MGGILEYLKKKIGKILLNIFKKIEKKFLKIGRSIKGKKKFKKTFMGESRILWKCMRVKVSETTSESSNPSAVLLDELWYVLVLQIQFFSNNSSLVRPTVKLLRQKMFFMKFFTW